MCYYWAAHQRELCEVAEQLKLARARIAEKEESLARAAMLASGLKRAALVPAPMQGGAVRDKSSAASLQARDVVL